jgi:hypothetical protein
MTRPSLADYGTHDESAFPHLWDGVVGAWCPSLGPTGLRLHDFSRRANWGTLTNMDASTDWVVDGGAYALLFGANKSVTMAGDGVILTGDFVVSFWARPTSTLPANRNVMQKQSGGLSLILLNDTVFSARSQSSGLVTWAIPSIGTSWTHFAFLRSGTSARVFANGTESTGGSRAFSGSFVIDCLGSILSPSTNFPGYLDGVVAIDCQSSPNLGRELFEIGRGGMYTPRRRRRAYSFGPSFQAGWARGSNVILQPCGVS